jgi:hypothetical protein
MVQNTEQRKTVTADERRHGVSWNFLSAATVAARLLASSLCVYRPVPNVFHEKLQDAGGEEDDAQKAI